MNEFYSDCISQLLLCKKTTQKRGASNHFFSSWQCGSAVWAALGWQFFFPQLGSPTCLQPAVCKAGWGLAGLRWSQLGQLVSAPCGPRC